MAEGRPVNSVGLKLPIFAVLMIPQRDIQSVASEASVAHDESGNFSPRPTPKLAYINRTNPIRRVVNDPTIFRASTIKITSLMRFINRRAAYPIPLELPRSAGNRGDYSGNASFINLRFDSIPTSGTE